MQRIGVGMEGISVRMQGIGVGNERNEGKNLHIGKEMKRDKNKCEER